MWDMKVLDYAHPNIKKSARNKIFKHIQKLAQIKKPKRAILTGKDLQRLLNQG